MLLAVWLGQEMKCSAAVSRFISGAPVRRRRISGVQLLRKFL